MAEQINSSGFSKAVQNGTVLVDFYSDTCMPCRRMMPVLEEVESEAGGSFAAVKVNVATDGDIADKYGVYAVPTFILFKDGEEKSRQVGALPKAEFASWIEQNR